MSSSSVDQIKERLSIVDVVSSYLKLERAGQNYKACCPFHNEKTPSFYVSPLRGSFYCFGCGAKGDIFTFVEQFEGTDFKGALQTLATRAGVTLEQYRGTSPEDKSEKDRMYALIEAATLFFEMQLPASTEALDYIHSRGVTDETIKHFRIGYAPEAWRATLAALRAKGFTDEEIIAAGLAKRPDSSTGSLQASQKGEPYDRFRNRIMFPISDSSGRVIAFSGRILPSAASAQDHEAAKYINSPETLIFKKGSTLYGLDKAKFEIRRRDAAILVEGQLDLVLSHQAGFINTVASSGTALSDSMLADTDKGLLSGLGQLRALSNNLVIAFDADKAGLRAAGRAERIALSLGMHVKVAKLPKGSDPADCIREHGAALWQDIIKKAQHIVLCYLEVLEESGVSEHTRMRAIRDRILPYIAVMPSAVERAHFIREIHAKTGIPEDALAKDVELVRLAPDTKQIVHAPSTNTAPVRTSRVLDRLLGLVIAFESKADALHDAAGLTQQVRTIIGDAPWEAAYGEAIIKKDEYLFEVDLVYGNLEHIGKEIEELLQNLEVDTLTKRLEELLGLLSTAERKGTPEELAVLLLESKEKTERLNTIKSRRFTKS